jgi:hypothetical protein
VARLNLSVKSKASKALMFVRLPLAFAAAGCILAVNGQTNPPTTADGPLDDPVSVWNYLSTNVPRFNIDATVIGSNPASRTADLSFRISTDFLNGINMIQGITLGLGAPTLFCPSQEDDSDKCLVYPIKGEAGLFPRNDVPYWSMGFRQLMISEIFS